MSFRRRGEGRPLVLIHGWCLNGELWTYATRHLMDRFDLVIVDLAGFGGSADLDGPYTIERHATDLRDLLEELDLDQAVLIGFAYGAAVAMACAASASDRIGALINVAVPSGSASPYAKMARSMQRDWPDFARRSAESLFHREQSSATLQWIERMFSATELAVGLDVVDELARFEPLDLAKLIDVPQLFIHAGKDAVAPRELGEACAEEAPNGTLTVIEDCGHLIVIDAKAEFHAVLDEELSSDILSAKRG